MKSHEQKPKPPRTAVQNSLWETLLTPHLAQDLLCIPRVFCFCVWEEGLLWHSAGSQKGSEPPQRLRTIILEHPASPRGFPSPTLQTVTRSCNQVCSPHSGHRGILHWTVLITRRPLEALIE